MRTPILVCLILSLSLVADANAREVESKALPAEEAKARETLKRMAHFVSGAETFQFHASIAHDRLLPTGEYIEIGNERTVTVRRPDRVKVELLERSGEEFVFVADGKQMVALSPGEGEYARLATSGNLDTVVDTLISEMGTRPPLTDLLYSDLWTVLSGRIGTGRHVGKAILDGVECEHLAFRNRDADWQLWVEAGDRPLPRRLVVHYARETGRPAIRATLDRWDLSPEVPDALFVLEVPKSARKVEMRAFAPEGAQRSH